MKTSLFAACCALAAVAQADTYYWCGPTVHTNAAGNAVYVTNGNVWSNATTGAKCTIDKGDYANVMVFDCAKLGVEKMSVYAANNGFKLGELRVENGDVTVYSLYAGSRGFNFGNPTNDVYVADGATLTFFEGASVAGAYYGASGEVVVRKTGGGTFKATGQNTSIGVGTAEHPLLKQFRVEEGTFDCVTIGADCIMNEVCIPAGVVQEFGQDTVQNSTVIRVEKGGTLHIKGDCLGAIVGDGDVEISNRLYPTFPSASGPYVFGGTMKGPVEVHLSWTPGENRNYLLTNPEAFAQTDFTFSSGVAKPAAGNAALQFAAGVGAFHLKRYQSIDGQPLVLEDVAGEPICVSVDYPDAAAGVAYTTGKGDFVLSGNNAGYTFSKGQLQHTGKIAVKNGNANVTLGSGKDGEDEALAAFAGFDSGASDTAILFNNAAAFTVTSAMTGAGKYEAKGTGALALENFRPTGGILAVDGGANVTLRDADASIATLPVANGGTLTISGGHVRNDAHAKKSTMLYGGTGAKVTVTDGGLLEASNWSVQTLEVANGACAHFESSLDPYAPEAAPQSVIFDGGTLRVGSPASSSFEGGFGTTLDASPWRGFYVKEGGIRFDVDMPSFWHGTSVGVLLSGAAAGNADGGVTVTGQGWLRIDGDWGALTGPVKILGTRFQPNCALTTSGDLELGTTRIHYSVRRDAHFAKGAGAKVTLSGTTAICPLHTDATTYTTYAFGPEGAARDGVFVRKPGAVLILMDANGSSSLFDGTFTTPAVTVAGGLSVGAHGLVNLPIFVHTTSRNAADGLGVSTGRGNLTFATWDDAKGFVEQYGTRWNELGAMDETTVALVENAAETTLAADAHVGALRVFGRGGAALTIETGATLEVGCGTAPGCVLLNNSHISGRSGAAQIAGGGTLDFGAREGVIAVNLAQSGLNPAEVNCTIAGSGGLALVSATEENGRIKLGAANVYAGDTHISGCNVYAAKPGCFGTGTVYAGNGRFYGGEVEFTAAGTWPNDFVIDGSGQEYFVDGGAAKWDGALHFSANGSTIAGTTTLAADTWIATDSSACKGTFGGKVTGTANLTMRGAGTIVFAAANDYSGTTTVSDGTLVVGAAGTLGNGPVVLDGATLRFETAGDVAVENVISGTGKIVVAGTGKVTLLHAADFSGSVETEGSGSFDLAGCSRELTTLLGSGSYANSGDAAELVVSNTALSAFAGSISGAISFVKKGTGLQRLTGALAYDGATTVADGKLAVGFTPVSATLPITDDVVRLDADAADSIGYLDGSVDAVDSWSDADGKDFTFAADLAYASDATRPTMLFNHVNGHNALHFDHSPIRLQAKGKALSVRTWFNVVAWGHDGAKTAILDGIFGKGAADSGIRINNCFYGDTQTDAINGNANVSTFTNKTFHLFTRTYDETKDWASPAVGDYFNTGGRPFGGDMCELLAYDRVLNAAEQDAVNEYLMAKWGVKPLAEPALGGDVLPAGTDLTVDEGATLFLNAVVQNVGTVSGTGAISNETAVCSTLVVNEDSVFGGTIGANVELLVKAGATLTLAPGAVLDENLVITLEEGAFMDLSGQTFNIKTLRGWKRWAKNGTFVQSRPYFIGFTVIVR